MSNYEPVELVTKLEEAATLCNMNMLHQTVAEIRGHSAPLADALTKLTGDFKYDEILMLIQRKE